MANRYPEREEDIEAYWFVRFQEVDAAYVMPRLASLTEEIKAFNENYLHICRALETAIAAHPSPGDKLGFLFLLDRICRTLGHRWTQYFTSGIVYLVAEAYQALDTSHVDVALGFIELVHGWRSSGLFPARNLDSIFKAFLSRISQLEGVACDDNERHSLARCRTMINGEPPSPPGRAPVPPKRPPTAAVLQAPSVPRKAPPAYQPPPSTSSPPTAKPPPPPYKPPSGFNSHTGGTAPHKRPLQTDANALAGKHRRRSPEVALEVSVPVPVVSGCPVLPQHVDSPASPNPPLADNPPIPQPPPKDLTSWPRRPAAMAPAMDAARLARVADAVVAQGGAHPRPAAVARAVQRAFAAAGDPATRAALLRPMDRLCRAAPETWAPCFESFAGPALCDAFAAVQRAGLADLAAECLDTLGRWVELQWFSPRVLATAVQQLQADLAVQLQALEAQPQTPGLRVQRRILEGYAEVLAALCAPHPLPSGPPVVSDALKARIQKAIHREPPLHREPLAGPPPTVDLAASLAADSPGPPLHAGPPVHSQPQPQPQPMAGETPEAAQPGQTLANTAHRRRQQIEDILAELGLDLRAADITAQQVAELQALWDAVDHALPPAAQLRVLIGLLREELQVGADEASPAPELGAQPPPSPALPPLVPPSPSAPPTVLPVPPAPPPAPAEAPVPLPLPPPDGPHRGEPQPRDVRAILRRDFGFTMDDPSILPTDLALLLHLLRAAQDGRATVAERAELQTLTRLLRPALPSPKQPPVPPPVPPLLRLSVPDLPPPVPPKPPPPPPHLLPEGPVSRSTALAALQQLGVDIDPGHLLRLRQELLEFCQPLPPPQTPAHDLLRLLNDALAPPPAPPPVSSQSSTSMPPMPPMPPRSENGMLQQQPAVMSDAARIQRNAPHLQRLLAQLGQGYSPRERRPHTAVSALYGSPHQCLKCGFRLPTAELLASHVDAHEKLRRLRNQTKYRPWHPTVARWLNLV